MVTVPTPNVGVEQAIQDRTCHICGNKIEARKYHFRTYADSRGRFAKNICQVCLLTFYWEIIENNKVNDQIVENDEQNSHEIWKDH